MWCGRGCGSKNSVRGVVSSLRGNNKRNVFISYKAEGNTGGIGLKYGNQSDSIGQVMMR